MKRIYSSVHLRLIVLFIAVCVMAADTLVSAQEHITDQATQIQEPSISPTTTLAPSSSPDQKTSDTLSENETTRITSFSQLRVVDRAHIEAAQTSFVGAPIPTAVQQVAIYRLSYDIKDQNGNWKPTTAKVFIPTEGKNLPLFVFGSGTTGMADKCAPSLENMAVENLGNYENHMIAQAAAGYVTVFPDYEGFHDPEATQAYFIVESEAKVLLGAVTNLLTLQPETETLHVADLKSVFLTGYSQGGHAALSTAREWKKLPDDVKLKGVIQFAGAADVEALFLESPWLASYLVDSYTQYYGAQLDSRSVLQDRWLIPLAKNNSDLCVNAAYKFYPREASKIYTPAFLDAIETHTWPSQLAAWKEFIDLNTPLTDLPDVPYLSIQGATDPIVTATAQRANVKKMCQQQHHVMYREFPGVNHFQVRQASFSQTNDWMKDVLAGRALQSDCP